MTTLDRSFRAPVSHRATHAWRTFVDEACVLAQALLSPNSVIDEVEYMRALHDDANRLETTRPAHAAMLRRRASRIGLR